MPRVAVFEDVSSPKVALSIIIKGLSEPFYFLVEVSKYTNC